MCLLLFITAGIFFGRGIISNTEANYFIISLFFIICGKNFSERILLLLTFTIGSVCYLLLSSDTMLLITEFMLLSALWKFNKNKPHIHTFWTTVAALLLHLYYIQNTPADVRQHDLGGILFYMRLITQNGINWLNFNPWHMYYLFHQPLHFIIYGYVYLAETLLWHSQLLAVNNLQYLSLFYVTGTTIFAALVFAEMKFSQYVYNAIFLIFAFNPTLTLFSGYISDDTPLLFWSCATIYFLLNWVKSDKTPPIIAAALCFSAGALTKLSMLMLVPAMSFLFLHRLRTSLNKQKIIRQLSVFIILAVPLSLLWVVRNHVLFDMPFHHVPDTSPEGQSFAHFTLFERISNFAFLFQPFLNAPRSVDPNIWLSLIKTELFGEWDFSIHNKGTYWPAMLLYLLNIGIKLLSAFGCVFWAFNKPFKSKNNNVTAYFFIIIYITIWTYSFKYSMEYPYACSCDYRLFAQLIFPELAIIGLLFQKYFRPQYLLIMAISYAFLSSYIYITGI